MISDFFCWLWDWTKRIFGRSKIIFANVIGGIMEAWVMLYDPIAMFDWDTVTDKHEVAIAIGIAIMVVNTLLRSFASNGPASFRALPEEEIEEVVPDEESLETSPKAH